MIFKMALKVKSGFTLLEVAAVVAIIAVLGAVVTPMVIDKIAESRNLAVRDDCKKIGLAITAFYKDTGKWPASSAGTATYSAILRSGNETGDLGAAAHDPRGATTISNTHGPWPTGPVDLLDNHLVTDSPGGTDNVYSQTRKLNWRGPYSESFNKRDPWGSNYLVYIKAMHTATTGTPKEYGWIISAGPNVTLQTGIKDDKLQGDDLGISFYSAGTGR